VHALLGAIDEGHLDLAEVVLRELTGQPLEAHDGALFRGALGGDERVERGLAAGVALELGAPEQLERHQLGLLLQHRRNEGAERLGLGGPADVMLLAHGPIVRARDGRLFLDAPDGSHRHARERSHLGPADLRTPEHLNLRPLDLREHRLVLPVVSTGREPNLALRPPGERRLFLDAPHRSPRDAGQLGDLRRRDPGAEQHANLLPHELRDGRHKGSALTANAGLGRRHVRSCSTVSGHGRLPSSGGQSFRNGGGQSFRNRQLRRDEARSDV
jgi:hypothetical protein